MSEVYDLSSPDVVVVCNASDLNPGDLVRFTYKKEKQANYRTRMGRLDQVISEKDGEIVAILVHDFNVDPDDYCLSDPEIRRFNWNRIGDIEVYKPTTPVVAPNTDQNVTFNLPPGMVALVKVGSPKDLKKPN